MKDDILMLIMVSVKPIGFLVVVAYVVITSIFYFHSFSFVTQAKSIHFFIPDGSVEKSLQLTAVNGGLSKQIVNQLSHNRIFAYTHLFLINVYRSVDPVFLFSLSGMSSMYDNQGPITMMFPLEFPFFLIAIIFLIKNWKMMYTKYWYILWLFGFSLFLSGICNPSISQLKLFPFVIAIRGLIGVAILESFNQYLWQKK